MKIIFVKRVFLLIWTILGLYLATKVCYDGQSIDDNKELNPSRTIVIGAVSCHTLNNNNSNVETVVMIKSVMISAKLYGIFKVDFYIFLEYLEEASYFMHELNKYGYKNGTWKGIQVNIKFYPAINSALIPQKYHKEMIYHKRLRCGFVRMFFPSALPEIDSIIYFDTDIVVTGNIGKLWENFEGMDDYQLVGIPRNMEGYNPNWLASYLKNFGDVPHVPPKGVNTGILLMNLTKMRKFGWEEKLLRLYDDYSRLFKMKVQRLVNILLYYNPGLLKVLTCEYHIFNKYCDLGFYCNQVKGDQYGVHVIHGAGNNFGLNGSLYEIFETYSRFDMKNGSLMEDVVIPIRKMYRQEKRDEKRSECYGTLNKYLFRNFFDENDEMVESAFGKY